MQDFAPLIAYLDRKFASLEDIFATKEELALIGVRVHEMYGRLEEKMDTKFGELYGYLDKQDAHMNTLFQEQTMMQGRLDRHDRWHHDVADRIGMKLKS